MAIDENTGLDDSTKPLNKNLPRRDISKINITTSKTPISKTYVDDKNLDIDAYEEERKKGVGFTLTPDSYVQAQPRLEELQKQKEIRLNDYLAYNQGLGEKIGNGLVKFGGRVYTSVVGSTIGSLYGLYSWARDGEFKSFYDNEFQKSLDGINDYLAEEYKHYYTSSKDDWEIGNFVFDKVFDGLGFATGAILSSYIGGSVTGALMKSFRLTNAVKLNTVNKLLNATDEIKNLDRFNKLTSSLNKINRTDQLLKLPQTTSSLVTGAVYESGVEARHAYNETKELLIDMYKQTHEGKAPTGSDLEEINKLSGETANGIFAANMALVGGGNILQFGKHMGLDFDDLRKMFKPTIAKEIVDETGKKAFISTGSKFVRGTRAVVKNAVIESQEEMLQSVITGTGKDYVANKYRDPEKDELGDLLNSSIKSFKKVYSSEEGWEEGFIGAIVGSAGVVAPRSRTKEDGTKQFPVTLAGGIIESVSDWRKSERKRDELISNLNSKGSIESLKAGVSHHIRESRNEKIKDNAIESNNALAFKNAQDDQFHSFVTSRIEAGMESTIQRDLNTLKEAPLEDFKRSMNIESSEYTEADRNKAIASFERRADMIIGSTKFIDKIYRGDNPQVREALIYNQSMANRIEERKNTISNEINELTGGNSIALNTFKENGERLSKSEIFKAVPKEHQFKKAEYEKLYEDYISLSDRQNKMYDELYALLDNKGESEAEKKIKEAEQEAVKRSTAKKKEEENIKKAKEGAEKANTIKAQKDAEDKKAKDIDNLNKTSSSLKEDLEEDNPNEIKMSSEDQLKMIKNIWEKSSIEDLTKFFEQTGESINNFPKPIREAFLKKKAALLEEKEKIDARNRDPKNTTGNIKKDKVVEATVESAINSDKSINEPPTDATKIKDNETELQKINQGSKVTIVDNKEIRENGTGIFSIEGLIIDAHNSVANSTITFIEDENGIKRLGQLNPNTNTDVLSSKLLQEGENITIELYTEPTFQTYNSEGIASEVIENKIGTTDQIMVVKDSKGRIFGYIHDIDYIKENRVYPTYQDKDNLKRNRDLLNQFRTKIFNHIQSTGLPYSSKIAGKSSGSIMEAITPKKYTTKLSDAILEDKRVKVLVVRDGGFYENGKRITKEEIDSDFQQSFSDTFFNKKEDGGYAGSTMIAVPSANGRYLLEFARNPKLLEEPHIAKEINTLLEAFVNKDFETLNTILNSKYDESSYETLELRNDVTDFISNFMYLNADINSPYRISLMKDGTIIFADVNGVMTVLQPNTEVFTTNLTKLKERVNNSYFAVNLIKGASNPWINFKNKEGVIEKIKYNDLVKNHLRVNFQGHQVTTSKGNEVVYTANPIISIQSEGSAQLGEIPTTKTKPTDTEGLFTKEEFDQAKQITSTESDIEAKKADVVQTYEYKGKTQTIRKEVSTKDGLTKVTFVGERSDKPGKSSKSGYVYGGHTSNSVQQFFDDYEVTVEDIVEDLSIDDIKAIQVIEERSGDGKTAITFKITYSEEMGGMSSEPMEMAVKKQKFTSDAELAVQKSEAPVSDIKAKKAEIERRRQEELEATKLNNSLSEFELENTPDLKTGSTSKRFKIKKDGKEVGIVSLNIDENGNVRIAYMEINPSNRRKGLAENFYKDLNKALQKNKQGVLYSDKVFLDELSEWERMKKRGELRKWVLDGKELSKEEIDALKKDINKVIELQDSGRLITEEAEDLQEVLPAQKMWEKLVEKGFAEKLEDGTYRFKYDAELKELENNNKTLPSNDIQEVVSADLEAKKTEIERRRQEGKNPNEGNYKGTTKTKDGVKVTTYEAFNKEGKRLSASGRQMSIEDFIKEYNPSDEDLELLRDGDYSRVTVKEVREKDGKLGITIIAHTSDNLKAEFEIQGKYDAELAALERKSKSEVSEQPINIKNNRLNKLKPKSKGYTSLEEAGSKNKEDKVKTVDDIIKENVTSEEIDKIAEEEKIPVENVKEAVKKEVISQMNEKKPTRKTSLLKKVANRIKKLLLSILIVTTFVNGFSFNYAPNEKSLAYDNVKVENLESFEEVYLEQEEMNKKDNLNTITDFYSETDEVYLVVDKQAAMSHLFQGDSLITSYEVGTGKVKGDSQTKTVVKDGKVLWDQGNMQTGAGIYTVGNEGQYKHSPAYTLINENGIEVSSALHETLDSRKKFFNNNNIKDNRMSYGCINFQSNSLKDLGNREEFKSGSKVFILPDSHTNEFRVIDGELKFISDDNTVNRSLIKYEYNPIEIKADNVNEDGKQFLMNLSENKEKLMGLYPTVSNDVYNTIVTIAYGIFGQESSFGTYGGVRGKYGYFKDQLANAFTDKDISIGVTQIRLSSVNQKTRDTFNIRTTNDLNNIDNSAIATMSLLLDIYENQIPNKMKSSYKELLPLAYSNRTEFNKAINGDTSALNNKYVQNVLKYAEDVTVYMGSGVKSEDVTNKNKKGLTKEEWKLLSTEERKSFNWQQKNCK